MKRWTGMIVTLTLGTVLGGYVVAPLLLGQVEHAPIQVPSGPNVSYRDVVKRVLPAVVSIETEMVVQGRNFRTPQMQGPMPFPKDAQVPEEFRRFFEDFRRSPFQQAPQEAPEDYQRHGFGSGFVISADGVIMTNHHVVADADKVTVQFKDGSKYTTNKIASDPKTDLAIVRIDTQGKKLPFLELGDSEKMEIGDPVLAFGAPFGLRGSVTHGIISATGRNGLHMNMYEDFLQTDAAINPGNSGGPLVNMEGKVIGINAAIKSRSGGFNGVGLAVASNLARTVKKSLLKDGVVHRGYLGVAIRDLTPDVAERLGLPGNSGVVVSQVYDKTPAAQAGMKAGDIITNIGGEKVENGRELQLVVAALPINEKTSVEVLRDGKKQQLTVAIEEQPKEFGENEVPQVEPEPEPKGTSLGKIGVDVQDLTPALAKRLGYDENTQGVVISDVEANSLAYTGGLRKGMLILKIDNRPVTSAEEAREAIARASAERGVLLQVRSPRGGTNYVLLQARGE